MKSTFRTTAPGEAAEVAAFLCRSFEIPPTLPLVQPNQLRWKYWDERPDWPGARGYALAREDGYLAHGAVVPLVCLSGGRRLRMVHLIDWAADPRSVGSGVMLLRGVARLVDAMLVVGGSDITRKVLPALGARSCGTVTRFARPLHPLKRLSGQKPTWRAGAQVARSLLWWWMAPRRRTPGWRAERVPPEDLASRALPWPRASSAITIFERTPESIAYLCRCPTARVEVFAASRAGTVRGYFILSHVPGQVRIVDFYADTEDPESWRAVLHLAIAEAKRNRDAAEVAAFGSDRVTRAALTDCGFHPRGDIEVRLLSVTGVPLPDEPIRVQMLESDAAYLHANRKDYWA